jgi:hypothetical protein
MPDWKRLVRKRLAETGLSASTEAEVVAQWCAHLEDAYPFAQARGRSECEAENRALQNDGLPPGELEEVASELAAHLEQTYEDALAHGWPEKAAVESALQEAGDWRVLAAKINRAKSKEGPMNQRTRTFWLPAILSLLGASLLFMLLERLGFQPREVRVQGFGLSLYWHWLAGLPAFGALGAHRSERAHGAMRVRLAAGLAPALTMLVVMGLILAWGLAIDGCHGVRFVGFGVGLLNWVAIPAVALLTGAAPFLKESSLERA